MCHFWRNMITYSDIYTFCAQKNLIHPPYYCTFSRGITIKAPLTGRKDASDEAEERKKTEL